MSKVLVSPSILNCDFARVGEECKSLVAAGADWIHCDVMDGAFVPNISFGAPIVKSVDGVVDVPLDVHLMIQHPMKYVADFVKAGADVITFHVEAADDVKQTIDCIKSFGVKVGLSIKPKTPVSAIEKYLPELDMVLVMSVEPGFGGQKFDPVAVDKITQIRALGYKGYVQVDGGINGETAKLVVAAGADVLVAGSYLVNAKDRAQAVQSLRG